MARKNTYEIHDNGKRLVAGIMGQAEARDTLDRLTTSLEVNYGWKRNQKRLDMVEIVSPRGHATVYTIQKV